MINIPKLLQNNKDNFSSQFFYLFIKGNGEGITRLGIIPSPISWDFHSKPTELLSLTDNLSCISLVYNSKQKPQLKPKGVMQQSMKRDEYYSRVRAQMLSEAIQKTFSTAQTLVDRVNQYICWCAVAGIVKQSRCVNCFGYHHYKKKLFSKPTTSFLLSKIQKISQNPIDKDYKEKDFTLVTNNKNIT